VLEYMLAGSVSSMFVNIEVCRKHSSKDITMISGHSKEGRHHLYQSLHYSFAT
jgi:hypothetical protein